MPRILFLIVNIDNVPSRVSIKLRSWRSINRLIDSFCAGWYNWVNFHFLQLIVFLVLTHYLCDMLVSTEDVAETLQLINRNGVVSIVLDYVGDMVLVHKEVEDVPFLLQYRADPEDLSV